MVKAVPDVETLAKQRGETLKVRLTNKSRVYLKKLRLLRPPVKKK